MSFIEKLKKCLLSAYGPPIILFFTSVFAYGLLIPWLGLYSDDWIFLWTSEVLGSDGLFRYFTTHRPAWGLLYQVTLPLLGSSPWVWHVFALIWRWVMSVLFWYLLRLIWPNRRQVALWAGLLFAIYPGYLLNPIALCFGHIYIVYCFCLVSFCFTVLALRNRSRYKLFTVLSLLTSLANLVMMEYFFTLEVLRFAIIFVILYRDNESQSFIRHVKTAFLKYLPYFTAFLAAVIYRKFFFTYQTFNYELLFIERFKAEPFQALSYLTLTILNDFYETTFSVWGTMVQNLFAPGFGDRSNLVWVGLGFVVFGFVFVGLLIYHRNEEHSKPRKWHSAIEMLALGLIGLLVCGWPFWITEIDVNLMYWSSRFTLPFMVGMGFVLAGILETIPRHWTKLLVISLMIGLSVGYHLQNANEFRRDWIKAQDIVQQIVWRMPEVAPGTTIMSSELPLKYYTSETISAMLNWIYAPENNSSSMDLGFYYPRESKSLFASTSNTFSRNHWSSEFNGKLDQLLVIHYVDGGCIQVLEDDLYLETMFLPEEISALIPNSSFEWIKIGADENEVQMPENIYTDEMKKDWCYYFEKADLARQLGAWDDVVQFGNEARQQGFSPNMPLEWIIFLKGAGQTEDWEDAKWISQEILSFKPEFLPFRLCTIWQNLITETSDSTQKSEAISEINTILGGCLQ
jgi:hypothetical protein